MDSGPRKHQIDQNSPTQLKQCSVFADLCNGSHSAWSICWDNMLSVTVRPLFAPCVCEMSYVSFSLHVNYAATWKERKQALFVCSSVCRRWSWWKNVRLKTDDN